MTQPEALPRCTTRDTDRRIARRDIGTSALFEFSARPRVGTPTHHPPRPRPTPPVGTARTRSPRLEGRTRKCSRRVCRTQEVLHRAPRGRARRQSDGQRTLQQSPQHGSWRGPSARSPVHRTSQRRRPLVAHDARCARAIGRSRTGARQLVRILSRAPRSRSGSATSKNATGDTPRLKSSMPVLA